MSTTLYWEPIRPAKRTGTEFETKNFFQRMIDKDAVYSERLGPEHLDFLRGAILSTRNESFEKDLLAIVAAIEKHGGVVLNER